MNISKLVASGITVAVIAIVLTQAALTVTAGATAGPKNERKEVICHATNSHQNPYTVNDVDKSSIDEVNNKYLNGHGDHEGPVWHEAIADHSWGDIIPPFTNDAGTSYLGQNWTIEGQKIHANGCKPASNSDQPETPGTTAPGGQGGGQVLGSTTTKSGVLADTGTPLLMNLAVGGSLLGTAGYITRRFSVKSTR